MFGFHGIGLPVPVFNVGSIQYLLRDEFTTDRAAGAVIGTAAEPGPGTRTVVDTENKISLSAGKAVFSGGKAAPAQGDPGIWLAAITRAAGRMGIFAINRGGASYVQWGFDTNQAGGGLNSYFESAANSIKANDSTSNGPVVMSISNGIEYRFVLALRASGAFYFISGGAFAYPTLVFLSTAGNTSTLYPSYSNYDWQFSSDYIRIPTDLWLPTPLVSDSFASAFGVSDGLGHAEGVAGGIGAGGSGLTWTQQAGTWTVASNRASASALSGGIAIATVPTSTADVIADVKVTRSAGQGGQVLRYADANNYLFTGHDGTNAVLKQRLAGVESTLITAAAAYSANAVLRCDLSGVNGRLYWNNALVGSTASINAGLTATAHGLYVTDVTANLTVDDFVVYAKGTAGEYAALDAF